MILFCHLEVKGFPFLDRQSSKITEKQATYMKVIVVFNFPVCIFLWLANPTINFEGNRDRQQHGDHEQLLEQLCCFFANTKRSAGTVVTVIYETSGCQRFSVF